MDLTRIAVKLRPRSAWEGIDLGFMLARQWFVPLWLLWLVSAVPLMVILTLLPLTPIVTGVLLWWFKPLYEPPLLYWLGHRLFDERPSWQEMRKHWRHIVLPHLFANLTWRRFSPSRSFVMPVAVLEKLKGKPRTQRIRVLGRNGQAGTWLTIIGIHFEVALEFSFIFLLMILIPEELLWVDWQSYLLEPDVVSEWIHQICALFAMSLVAPFYVAGGFALYLTRRSELEAWDLELGLKRMAQRYRQSRSGSGLTVVLLLCLSLSMMSAEFVWAGESDRELVRETIDEVLAEEDFGRYEERTSWKFIGEIEEEDNSGLVEWLRSLFEGFSSNIAAVSELLLWLLAGGVLAYLIYWFLQNSGYLRPLGKAGENGHRNLPTHIAGLDLRPESLPEDPATLAAQLIESGEYREAFSLLYRGALSALVHRHAMEIPDGATEGECSHLADEQLSDQLNEFFSRLTVVWLMLAYGHHLPEKTQALDLCQQWQACFGGES
ncbi:MAG: hypothetical protein KZQ85_01960 [Candidatus Thiodiazotropha sp. (ex Myrtea sp. 'scaly one' KF741663)]|nr:hypothetical protein [Candidatus Thiodiazotropha sp. (ex Myrtea sp. 'scaly one' KF741663)]